MATTMGHHQLAVYRSGPQKVCIALGYVFMLIGLIGMILPGVLGMHLSMLHNFVHLGSGALALWTGYSDFSNRAFNFCVTFGSVYGFLGIAGFIFGTPGYPGVGHMEADQNLLRILPNVLELGTNDHIVHIFLGAIFLMTAWNWRKDRKHVVARPSSKIDSEVDRLQLLNKRTTLNNTSPRTNTERKI